MDDQPERRATPSNPASKEERTDFERDLDRLLYTLYFRRLSGITQVASMSVAESSQYGLVHNRLTHSLKVGQVSRRMTQYLQLRDKSKFSPSFDMSIIEQLNPDVAEFAGRAHDIGHPPFGHLGDEVLNALTEKYGLTDGFEGNAQSLRVLTSLARRKPVRTPRAEDDDDSDASISLQLTHRSIASIVKYPFAKGKGSDEKNEAGKFGYIAPDESYFTDAVKPLLVGDKPTLEAQIMDWADDITYATHDIEDFGANGRIPLALLKHDSSMRPVSEDEVSEFKDYARAKLVKRTNFDFDDSFKIVARQLSKLPTRIIPGSTDTATSLGRMTSGIITQATDKTSVDLEGNLDPDRAWAGAIDILKLLTWFYVIDSPELVP